MQRCKILYFYSSSQNDTGSPAVLLQMIDSLDRKRFIPVYLAACPGPLLEDIRQRDVEVIEQPVVKLDRRRLGSSLHSIYSKYRLLKTKGIDIVHMNLPGWNDDVVLAAFLARVPVILHIHNPIVVGKKNLNWRIASRILFCSHALKTSVSGIQTIEAKSTVLYNAVDIERFRLGRAKRHTLNLDENTLVIGIVGQISRRKGIDIFLETARIMIRKGYDIKFIIVGPPARDEQEYYKKVATQAETGGLKGRVSFLGTRSDIPDLMKSMDVFFFPTRAEPFGLVVIEAMAAGLPVVASHIGGIPEIINTEKVGLCVSPSATKEFVAGLEKILKKSKPERHAMGLCAQKRAAYFGMTKMGTDLRKIYEELTSSPKAGL